MKKDYYLLWLLLLTAFGVVAGASCLDHLSIGSYELKRAPLAEELLQPISQTQEPPHLPPATVSQVSQATNSATDTVVVPGSLFPVPVDTTSKTILFFGDSMLEGLSPRLAAYCKENGHKLYTVIWYSSTTEIWGRCDTLSTFIRRWKPDYVVACLGANELFVRDIEKKRQQPFNHIMQQIGDRPLLWIGPPNWKEDTGINNFLASRLPQGAFFLSNGMSFDRKSDGAHPTAASSVAWMDSVVRWMPAHSNHPIKMDTPSETRSRATKVVVLQPLKK